MYMVFFDGAQEELIETQHQLESQRPVDRSIMATWTLNFQSFVRKNPSHGQKFLILLGGLLKINDVG